jgi:hypothetical protein
MSRYSDKVLAKNPVAYWRLNEPSGTVAVDKVGGNHGTYLNTPSLAAHPLISEAISYADFDAGSSERVDFASSSSGNDCKDADAVSIEAWVSPDVMPGGTGFDTIFNCDLDAGGKSFIRLNVYGDDQIQVSGRSVAADGLQHGYASGISINKIYHVVGILDYTNDKIDVYVNGVFGSSTSVTFSSTTLSFTTAAAQSIGRTEAVGASSQIDGTIGEVSLYNYALTSDQILENYLEGKYGEGIEAFTDYESRVKEKSPVAYWKLDETTGATAVEEISGNDGTYTNTPTLNQTSLITTGSSVDFTSSSSQWIDLGTTKKIGNLLDGSSAITIEAWINYESDGAYIFFTPINNGQTGITFNFASGGLLNVNTRPESSDSLQATTTTISINTTYHVVAIIDYANDIEQLYVDGILKAESTGLGWTATTYTVGSNDGTKEGIGAYAPTPSDFANGLLDEVAIYNYPLTEVQIRENYFAGKYGNYSAITDDYELAVKQDMPVAYWKLDETSGTEATEEISGNHGTYVNTPTLNQTGLITTGSSVDFDGVNQYINIGNGTHPVADLIDGKSVVTMEAWFNTDTVPVSDTSIFVSQISANDFGFLIQIDSTSSIRVGGRSQSGDSFQSATDTESVVANTVYHVIGMLDFTNDEIKLYVNGQLKVTESVTFGVATYTLSAHSVEDSIGRWNSGATEYFDGQIDEVAIYNYPLTQDQITEHYLKGKYGDISNFTDYEYAVKSKSPVAYWRLDEQSGTNAVDETGNYDLTYTNSPALNRVPLIKGDGSAVEFNGTDQYCTRTEANFRSGDSEGSIECWFSTSNVTTLKYIFATGDETSTPSMGIFVRDDGKLGIFNSGAGNTSDTVNSFNDGNIHHAVITSGATSPSIYVDGVLQTLNLTNNNGGWFDQITGQDNVTIGCVYKDSAINNYFDGTIDEVAVYDYELTHAQIIDNYLKGSALDPDSYEYKVLSKYPVAYWKLDEPSGTTAKDSVGGYDLTYRNTPSLGQTSATGDGNAVEFVSANSEDASLTISNFRSSDNVGTIEGWFKLGDTGTGVFIFGTSQTTDNRTIYVFVSSSTGAVSFNFHDNTAWERVSTVTGGFNDNLWHHAVVTSDGSTWKIFVDGIERDLTIIDVANTGEWFADVGTTTAIRINSWERTALENIGDGSVDEVAIYDYPLTLEQIQENYNAGNVYTNKVNPYLDGLEQDIIQQAKPLLYYKFDDFPYLDNEATVDYSENRDHSATIVGSPSLAAPLVESGKSLSFASGDYLELGSRPELNFGTGDWTVEFWFYYYGTSANNPCILSNGTTSWTTNKVSIIPDHASSNPNKLSLYAYDFHTILPVVDVAMSDSTLYHAVFTRKGTTVSLYMDGTLVDSQAVSGALEFNFNDNSETTIADDVISPSGAYDYVGELDNLAIYNRALSYNEIAERYKSTKIDAFYAQYDPIFHYRCDEASGPLYDSAGKYYLTNVVYSGTPTYGTASDYFEGTGISTSSGSRFRRGVDAFQPNDTTGSIELWCKSTGSGERGMLSLCSESGSNHVTLGWLGTSPPRLALWSYSAGTYGMQSSSGYDDGNWHHVVGTSDGSNYHLYVDGVEDSFTPYGTDNGNWIKGLGTAVQGIMIGAHTTDGSNSFWQYTGDLDNILYYARELTAEEVYANYQYGLNGKFSKEQDHIQKLNPVGYWKLDELSGTTAVDSSESGYDGTYVSSPALGQTGLTKTGNSVDFDGSTQNITTTNTLTISEGFTFEGWVKTSATTNQMNLFDSASTTAYGVTCFMGGDPGGTSNAGTFAIGTHTASNYLGVRTTANSFNDDSVHHVVMTLNNSGSAITYTDFEIYVDGIKQPTTTSVVSGGVPTFPFTTDVMNIANRGNLGTTPRYDGLLDQVAVYDYPLSPEQIYANYLEGTKDVLTDYEVAVKSKSPIAYWKLDETSGTDAVDEIGGYDGTYTNTPDLEQTPLIQTGTSIYCDTNNAHVLLPSVLDTGNNGVNTIEFWASHTDSTTQCFVWDESLAGDASNRLIIAFNKNSSGFSSGVMSVSTSNNTGTYAYAQSAAIAATYDGDPHHYVVIMNNGTGQIYMDAELIAENTGMSTQPYHNSSGGNGHRLGYIRNGGTDANGYIGYLDEVSVYDYALTPAQIQENYEVGKGTLSLTNKPSEDVYYG